MVYPNSPFNKSFDAEFLQCGAICTDIEKKELSITETLTWLCGTPKYTSFRVNTLKCNVAEALDLVKREVEIVSKLNNRATPKVEVHSILKDVLIVQNWEPQELEHKEKKIIVDTKCGEAILRGSHIFAPGVLGMSNGTQINDEVSIYVDIERKCKKGAHDNFMGVKELIAVGRAKMTRQELFKDNIEGGVAVEIIFSKYGSVPLRSNSIAPEITLLQNIPSVICSYVLNPQPSEVILDMCAAPGNKTTHLAALMKNIGTLIAIDKTANKVKQLETQCSIFGATVKVYQADSTKILSNETNKNIKEGPPFSAESFDRILLDAPCSALGKRPQLSNSSTKAVLESHIPIQRRLIDTAVQLLKPNGVLVYSTCSIALAENEAIIAWALNKFSNIQLENCTPHLGGPGLQCSGLTLEDCKKLQRFDNNDNIDSIGFFIACLRKK